MKTLHTTDDEIRRIVREVIREEINKLRADFVAYVSDEEQVEIEAIHGKTPAGRTTQKSIQIEL